MGKKDGGLAVWISGHAGTSNVGPGGAGDDSCSNNYIRDAWKPARIHLENGPEDGRAYSTGAERA